MAKLIFGCGYLGGRVAAQWIASGEEVHAVTRRAEQAAQLELQGICPHVGDVTDSLTLPEIASLETVMFAVGYDRTPGKSIQEVYVRGLKNALERVPGSIRQFIYISSTGVYGQSDGEWIDENSVCRPRRAGGRACLAAEQQLATHRLGSRAVVLRMAGLYGPGRLPKLRAVQAGQPLEVASQATLNLIHIDDAARTVLAAEKYARPPSLYVVSDGHPVKRAEFYRALAKILDAPPPRFAEPAADLANAERSVTSKRVNNARMRDELKVALLYPDYQRGLESLTFDKNGRSQAGGSGDQMRR
jgi:nucleoside-diphosphate-sugar epimerase